MAVEAKGPVPESVGKGGVGPGGEGLTWGSLEEALTCLCGCPFESPNLGKAMADVLAQGQAVLVNKRDEGIEVTIR